VSRVRRHPRLLSSLAVALLALTAELAGRSLTHRLDVGRHVEAGTYAQAAYYPVLLACVKVGIALLLARLAWRLARAFAIGRTARHVPGVVTGGMPRVRLTLTPRLWFAFFAVTATTYLVHADLDHVAAGRWALFFPWIHSSALPVFAVVSVLLALVWSVVQRWLADYERFVEDAARLARHLTRAEPPRASFPHVLLAVPPRRLFGLVLDSRPPPVVA
jgi:hypothetical protein